MKFKRFLLTTLALLIISGASSISADTIPETRQSEIHPIQEFDLGSHWPSGKAVLFSVPTSAESSANLRDRLPQTSSEEDKRSSTPSTRNHFGREIPEAFYFQISGLIDGSQTTRKLLFPFHSFL